MVEFKTIILTLNKFSFINRIKLDHHWREITLQQLNVVGDSCKSTFVIKRKADILSISYDISIHQWLSNIFVDVMLNSWWLLIISRWIMLWNKAVFCLEVLIYKRLQMWRHNDVIGSNEYLISTLSESTVP